MRLGVVYLGIGMIVIGIVFSATLIGALFGIPLGFLGFIVLIVGLVISDGSVQQPQTGFAPQNQYRIIPQQVAVPSPNQTLSADSKFCDSCRSRIPNSYEFCNVCGRKQQTYSTTSVSAQQTESKFCASCGTKMPNVSVFCPNCGVSQN
jgi:hypothetical protein